MTAQPVILHGVASTLSDTWSGMHILQYIPECVCVDTHLSCTITSLACVCTNVHKYLCVYLCMWICVWLSNLENYRMWPWECEMEII